MKSVHVTIALTAVIVVGLAAHHFFRAQSDVKPFPLSPKAPTHLAHTIEQAGSSGHAVPLRAPPVDLQPKSFNSAKDVWKFAQAALQSSSEAQAHEGYVAARECFGISATWSEYSNFASGSSNSRVQGKLTPERQLAIQALAEKCGGFMSAGKAKTLELIRGLDQRQRQLGGGLSQAEKEMDSPAKATVAVSKLLLSDSPAAVEAGLTGLADVWAAANKIASSDPRIEYMATASRLVACDLGKDCGSESYSAQLWCAMQGECSGPLWHNWSDNLSQEQIQEITTLRKAIQAAVKAGDLTQLGIKTDRASSS